VVRWFRNDQGLVTSGVQANEFKFSITTNGSEVSIGFSGSKEVLDPLEGASEFANAFRDANAQADAATQGWAGQLGRVHLYWKKKKEVLHDKYQIDWKSPAELNPMTRYD